MPSYVEVAVNLPQVSGTFDYHLLPEMEEQVQAGCLVTVPFGSRVVQGVILRRVETPSVAETRPVLSLVDKAAGLTDGQIWLAGWLAENTLSLMSKCIELMLPPGIGQQADMMYTLLVSAEEKGSITLTALQARLINLLKKRGPLRSGQIDNAMPRVEWRPAARFLVKNGILKAQSVLPAPRIQPKFVRTARLAVPPEEAERAMQTLAQTQRKVRLKEGVNLDESLIQELGRVGSEACTRRYAMLEYLQQAKRAVDLQEIYAATRGKTTDLNRLLQLELIQIEEASSPTLEKRQSILRALIRQPGEIEAPWLYAESGGGLEDLYVLEERGLIMLGESEIFRDPLNQIETVITSPPSLTHDQQAIWAQIQGYLREPAAEKVPPAVLLHGVTGSGKTEIYLHAVQEILQAGKQAIVLVPEIALTPQTIRRFMGRFPGRVGLVHSGLSAGERYDTWRRAKSGSLSVVVGPRSALFTPFVNLGLIVVDECHDDSYFQGEIQPHYHAVRAAMAYAAHSGVLCLLGSATPDVTDYFQAVQAGKGDQNAPGKRSLIYLHLPNRILAHREVVKTQLERLGMDGEGSGSRFREFEADSETIELPEVQIVDMRQELRDGNRSIFSQALQDGLKAVLDRQQQAILFLNRRGTATYVFCRNCGLILKCPHCDLPLIYHQRGREAFERMEDRSTRPGEAKLVCHHCGYARKLPEQCPQCQSPHIRQYGTGTERVVDEIEKIFPQARSLRWDWETTRQKGAHEIILSHFLAHRADILVGTQMLAKGLDLPFVTLVGAVIADVGLALPDYRANERTFQVLMQVAGRAGRSPLGGRVIFQTFQPEHYVIQAASAHDYEGFATNELKYRKRLGYPPFVQIVRLEYRHPNLEQAEKAGKEMAGLVKNWLKIEDRRATHLLGPYPPFFAKAGGMYRVQIILRGPDPASIFRNKERMNLLSEWHVEVNPPSLL